MKKFNYEGFTSNYYEDKVLAWNNFFNLLNNFENIGFLQIYSPFYFNIELDNTKDGITIWRGGNCDELVIRTGWNNINAHSNQKLTGISRFDLIENLSIWYFRKNIGKSDYQDCWEELGDMTWLKSLSLIGNGMKNEDTKYLSTLINLNSLILSEEENLSDISALSTLTNLKNLDLSKNQVSALWPLENLVHLGEVYDKDEDGNDIYGSLNLENNPLTDIRGTYIGSDGAEHEYYNMRILANLNINKSGQLQYLYLNGCTNITENGLNVLRDSSLTWKGKSGF